MSSRTRTIASFFSVAMVTMLLGAFVSTQIHQPRAAQALLENQPAPAVERQGGSITLDTFRDIARLYTAGVVNINTTTVVSNRRSSPFPDDLMHRFFGPQPESRTQTSLGSGFVIDEEGYVLTNRHVIEGADSIRVTLADGQEYEAELVGRDARTDVALVKIDPEEPLTVLSLGDSAQTEVGEWVMAIGNPFGLGGNSVTVGVVSFKGRPLRLQTQDNPVEMLQTDASINPGNSGGPLLDSRGQVIGINTMIITRGAPQSAGVGFAVPINVAKEILPQLRERGKVVRGWLGVQIQSITEDLATTLGMEKASGAIVSDVNPSSPADRAGLQPGDVIVAVDGEDMEDNNHLTRYISTKPPGTEVELRLLREGETKSIRVTLGTFPDAADVTEDRREPRAQLGMALSDLTPDLAARLELPRGASGVVVMAVEAGEPAEEAGLRRLDVIVSVNGRPVAGVDDFEREIERAESVGLARLRVRRRDNHLITVLRLR